MAEISVEQHQSLEAAYRMLSDDPAGVSVDALRKAAGVRQNIASAWLRRKRADEQAATRAAERATLPQPPAEVLNALGDYLRDDLWPAVLAAAREELVTRHAAELADAHLAQQAAEDNAAQARVIADAARGRLDEALAKLTAAEASLTDLRKLRDQWVKEAKAAQQDAKAAQTALAERDVELATLRGELTGLRAAVESLKSGPGGDS